MECGNECDGLFIASEIILFIFLILYYTATILTFFISVLHLAKKKRNISKVLMSTLPLCFLARSIDLTVTYLVTGYDRLLDDAIYQSPWLFISASLPVYMFFSNYVSVCLYWILLLHKNVYLPVGVNKNKIKLWTLIIYGILYGFWLGIVIAFFATPESQHLTIHTVETIYAALLSFIAGVVFVIIGPRLYSKLTAHSSNLYSAVRVSYTTVVCTFVFLFRGCFILISFYLFTTKVESLVGNIIWFLVAELIPSSIIIAVIYSEKSKVNSLLGDSSPSLQSSIEFL